MHSWLPGQPSTMCLRFSSTRHRVPWGTCLVSLTAQPPEAERPCVFKSPTLQTSFWASAAAATASAGSSCKQTPNVSKPSCTTRSHSPPPPICSRVPELLAAVAWKSDQSTVLSVAWDLCSKPPLSVRFDAFRLLLPGFALDHLLVFDASRGFKILALLGKH